jgi:hypothetical protein
MCFAGNCRYHYCQCGTNKHEETLGATLTDVAWVITAYAIANVIVIPMTSWLCNLEDEIILPFQ